jgi:SPP1 gp7 family putative phage head morphogenesis protein
LNTASIAAPALGGEVIVGWNSFVRGQTGLVYNTSELVGKQGLKVFDLMRRSDQIKAALSFKRDTILAPGWSVQSPADMPEDWPPTLFVQRRLAAMETSLDRVLHKALRAMEYGFSIAEMVWEIIPYGEDAGLVGLRKIKPKRPHDFTFETDAFNNVIRVRNDVDGALYDPKKLLIYVYGASHDQVYGESDLEAAYRPWKLEGESWKWLAQFLERQGVPPLFALYNPESLDKAARQDLQEVLENIQSATVAAIPRAAKDHFEFWSPSHSGHVDQLFKPAIEMMQQGMARGLLMPGFIGLSPDALGSYARARVSFDMFILHCQYVQRDLSEETVQAQIIRRMVDFNFDTDGAYPIFRFNPLTDEQVDKLATAWASLVGAGAVIARGQDEDHLRSSLGFPKRQIDELSDDANLDPRIPISALEKVAPALRKNEVRRAVGLPPDAEFGEEPMVAPPPEPEPDPEPEGPEDPEDPTPPGGGAPPEDEGEDEEEDKPEAEEADMRALARERMLQAFKKPERDPNDPPITEEDFTVEEDPRPDVREETLTPQEKRAELAKILDRLGGVDDDAVQAIAAALRRDLRRQIDAWAKSPPTLKRAGKVKVSLAPSVRTAIMAAQRKVYGQGRSDAKREVGQVQLEAERPSYDPKAALAYLEAKGDFFVTGLSETLTELVRGEILGGLREGRAFTGTASRLLDALAPWIGAADADPKALMPDRLLTVVRTVSTDAYNQGRLVEARRLGGLGLVKGMTYSAVLDSRTTPICRHLHGKSWRIDDPELARYTPPNHYRCRSILLPATIADEIPAYITPEESAEASRLADGKFGGSYRDTKANKPPG